MALTKARDRMTVGAALNVRDFGALGNDAANDTQAIQAAINAAAAAGTGTVYLPGGIYRVGASAEAGNVDNFGATLAKSSACLILYPGVSLRGDGIARTIIKGTDQALTLMYMISPDGGAVEDMTWDGIWSGSGAGAGHGMFTVQNPGTEGYCRNFTFRNLHVQNVASYCIGLQAGNYYRVLMENIRCYNSGADALDIKSRGTGYISEAIHISNISIEAHGRRVIGSAGIDIRGRARLSNIYVRDVGSPGMEQRGLRFRTHGTHPNEWGQYSSVSNFFVEGNGSVGVIGFESGSADCIASNGIIKDMESGVLIGGNATDVPSRNIVANVTVINSTLYAFEIGAGCPDTIVSGCHAVSAGLAGFRNVGTNTTFIGCDAPGTAAPFSTSAAASTSQITVGSRNATNWLNPSSAAGIVQETAAGADPNVDIRFMPKGTGGCELRANGGRALRADNSSAAAVNWVAAAGAALGGGVEVSAQGVDDNIDLLLTAKGTGRLRFGARVASADAPVTGYIEVKDAGGTLRRLAVIG